LFGKVAAEVGLVALFVLGHKLLSGLLAEALT
jgi:hypothetical protein